MMHPAVIKGISKYLSELLNQDITFEKVHDQVMLMEFGMEPTDEMLANFIKAAVKQIEERNGE